MDLGAAVFSITLTSASMIALLKIIAIDIILSGDNAIVIAMATRNLPKKQQNKAILWGTGGAVILRILFAIVIVWLLKIPYVNIIGGILLLWISYKVLVGGDEETHVSSQSSLIKAIGTIIMADAVMSLDNVVAIAGAANGHILMIALGVLVSIPIMIFGSKLIVKVMEKFQWISYIGSGILAWVAGEMLLKDKHIDRLFGIEGPVEYIVLISLTILVLLVGFMANKKKAVNKDKLIPKNEH
ncbi:TerC family protein [Bacillus niameyensis]|uniref:TerC family protein n=1 Tax=Bacillus niameyensis TaxID=1522308 RepID=UPI000B13C335|nr:TerC family protein [Bacillus niameyensis]